LSLEAARRVRQLVEGARAAGAHLHIDPEHFYADTGRSPYLAPQLISGVSHEMPLMRERCSGPVICVMPVRDDEEATRLINDSRHARAAVLWTRDEEAAARLALELTVGEVCVNRRDPFTPCLTWRRGRSNP
jgi:acyl-CoA reductase-like NAD-dependent aldehyde dehydrogenase